jgi:tRNA(fMet)-specific endonuclease VapC
MKAILLDTNAITALFRGDPAVVDIMAKSECIYISAIVIGELEDGFRGGSQYNKNLKILNELLERPSVMVLPVGRESGECFGRVKNTLRKKGKPIPINDVWIAAQCLETGALLVTYDAHFNDVDGLRIWSF